MTMYAIRYRSFLESLAKYIAENYNGGSWDYHYNEEQKAYWEEEAKKLMKHIQSIKIPQEGK